MFVKEGLCIKGDEEDGVGEATQRLPERVRQEAVDGTCGG